MSKSPTITVNITADTKGAKQGVQEAQGLFKGLGSKMSGFMAGAGAAVGTFAIQAAGAAKDFAMEGVALAKSAELFGKKADTVFGKSSTDIKKWADSVNESFGLSDEAVVGMAANMGDLLKPMGFTESATADMTKTMLNAAGALLAWSGGTYDAAQVSDIMTKAMLGERDGLKALGISISAAEVEARLLEKGQKDLTGAAKQQAEALATQELIMEKSVDAQKAWSDGTMDSVKSQNEMNAAMADAKTAVGKFLLPILQKATKFITSTLIPGVRALVDRFKEAWPTIKATVLRNVAPLVDWFKTNWPKIQQVVSDVMARVQEIISVVIQAVQWVWSKFGSTIIGHVQRMAKNVINLVKGLMKTISGVIDLVMGIIKGDWKRAWKGVQDIFKGLWTAIKAILRAAWDSIKYIFKVALIAVRELLKGYLTFMKNYWLTVWNWVRDRVVDVWNKIKDTVSGGVSRLVEFVKSIPGRIKAKALEAFAFLATGYEAVKGKISTGIETVVGWIRGLPSRITSAASGMWDGIATAFKSAINTIIRGWNAIEFKIPGFKIGPVGYDGFTLGVPDIPQLAKGGIVKARPGGILANIGEGRYDEAVVPLTPEFLSGRSGNRTTNIYASNVGARDVARLQREYDRRNGR